MTDQGKKHAGIYLALGDYFIIASAHSSSRYNIFIFFLLTHTSSTFRFASGGADNLVILWKITGQGQLKYTHTGAIQKVKFGPSSIQLASCSDVDFGLWTPEQKQVLKEKVTSRILSAAWTSDGTLLAIGMHSGLISLRNQQAVEVLRIERKTPVWCMVFIPNQVPTKVTSNQTSSQTNITEDTLAVGSWDKVLSFYKFSNSSHKIQSEKQLRFYPCSIDLAGSQGSNKFNYLIISGSDKRVSLYSRDGVRLADVISKDSWVWSAASNTSLDRVVAGTVGGSIDSIQMNFEAVHALYKDRYAYRENLTDIIVQHLKTDRKVRIKCKDLVRRIALYKNKLAVQQTDRVCIYESNAEDTTDMHFRLRRERFTIGEKACDSLAITSYHLIFCRSNTIELYSFDGQRPRVWQLESPVKYMKVDGGPEGREGVIVGLESGVVMKIYVDNPFPIELTKRTASVISADTNIYRTKLACVDSNNVLTITDLKTQDVLFTQQGVIAACFNTEVDGILSYTSINNSMYVVSGLSNESSTSSSDPFFGNAGAAGVRSLRGKYAESGTASSGSGSDKPVISEPQEQHARGLTLGFQGQKIYCLYRGGISAVDVPQSANLQAALDSGDMKAAYNVACLGATEADWKLLAMRALRSNCISVAKNAFARLKDTKFLSLIEQIERGAPSGGYSSHEAGVNAEHTGGPAAGGSRRGNRNIAGQQGTTASNDGASTGGALGRHFNTPLAPSWIAEILAYEGHHHEAAKVYARSGRVDEAIRLFTDLRRWNDAKMFAQNAGQNDLSSLTAQQAKWLQEINDWKGASELYCSMGQHQYAAKIVSEAATSSPDQQWQLALIDIVRTIPVEGNVDTLLFCGEVFSKADETEYARETFKKAGDITKLMELYVRKQMWTDAAALAESHDGQFDVSVFLPYAEWLVSQDRYDDAQQAYKKAGRQDLARKVLEELTFNSVSEARFKDAAYYYWLLSKEAEGSDDPSVQYEYEHKADLYFAYATVHAYVNEPFTTHQPETLFQVSRFIINSLGASDSIPYGISKASTLYTLAKQALTIGAFKLARHSYDRLGKLQLPARKQDEIELDMLIVQARPVRDDPDHLPVCYRCSSTNPLLNPFTNKFAKGDVCTNCGHPFVRSFINFDILPLVEFVPEPSISDEEAIEMIRQPPSERKLRATGRSDGPGSKRGGAGRDREWKEDKEGNADILSLGNEDGGGYDDDYGIIGGGGRSGFGEQDLFTRCLNHTLETQENTYIPVTVNANTLLAMKRSEVFVCRPSSSTKRATFYRNMLPDIAIAISQPCHRFFHLEDFEFAYLSSKSCPYSRLKSVGEYGSL